MAAALLGKCFHLLVLVVFLYTCCYGFKIREHGLQAISTSTEQSHRATCDSSIFGRCPEKTPTPFISRKWHETPAPRLAIRRKPPVEVTLDHGDGDGVRARLERISRSTVGVVDDGNEYSSDELGDDEEEVIVEVEYSDEAVINTGEDDKNEKKENEDTDEDENEHDDDDDDDDDENGDKDKDEEKEDKMDTKQLKLKLRVKEEQSKEEMESKKKGVRPFRELKKANDKDEADDTDENIGEFKKKGLEKRLKETKPFSILKVDKVKHDEKDSEEKDEDEAKDEDEDKDKNKEDKDADNDEGRNKHKDKDKDKSITKATAKTKVGAKDEDTGEDQNENQNEDKDEIKDDDQDEDDNGSDDKESEKITTPPMKLEKVRFADKDKIKSVEVLATVTQKSEVEVKQPVAPAKKEEEQKIDVIKKQAERAKKPTESLGKSIEILKKAETVKVTKSDSESPKAKAAPKPEATEKVSVKPEEKKKVPVKLEDKEKTSVKPEAKRKADTVTGQGAQTKAKVKRYDKDNSKGKTNAHVDASFTLAELNDALLHVPTFVPNFTAVENFECQQQGKILLRQLRGRKLWTMQMLDSSAKISSGMLRGNINQFGDFDQCLGIMAHVKLNNSTIRVQGKYCLASVDLYPTHPDMRVPVNLMQARAPIRANLHDTGHFIPQFTTANWALCLPAVCSAQDAENVMKQALSHYNSTIGIKFALNVDPKMCYVKQKSDGYSKETIGVLYFYAMFVCLALVATVRDYLVTTKRKENYSERIIMAFSLRRTVKSLFNPKKSKADIACIHGIRTLMTIIIYISHKVSVEAIEPFTNRIYFTEASNVPATTILRVATIYTEVFVLLSGVLSAYNMAHEYTNRGEIRWFCRFITRYIRLTPSLVAVVFWYAFVMEHIGSGPLWNRVVTANADLCKKNAWTNLLYIQNFFPFEEMCATHTHQLALDMQLSLVAPILVFFLKFKLIIGVLLIVFCILLAATLRYIAMMGNNLSLVVYHGMSLRKLYKTANLTYTMPLHRLSPYVCGVGLGVLLHYTKRDFKIHKVFRILGWLIALALGLWSIFSPPNVFKRDYTYDVEEATNYGVISPVYISLATCWSIFACYTHDSGVINKFLSSYWLLILSRLSYAIYLTQFAVFFYNIGTIRYPREFHLRLLFDLDETVIVLIVSIIITLLFDLPMQEFKNVIMESTDMLRTTIPTKENLPTEVADETQKTILPEQQEHKVYEDDEVASTGWDWQKDIVHGGTKQTNEVLEDEEEVDMPIMKKTDRRKSFMQQDFGSSESEEEILQRKKLEKRHTTLEPRISDEEDWEGELRIRRKQFIEKLATQERDSVLDEEDLASLRRRSSAEGKIAMLKDPSPDDNMDSWTISVGSRVAQLGSSQERSEPEEDYAYIRRREFRERAPPPREDTQSEEEIIWDSSRIRSSVSSNQVSSVEEDEDVSNFNFVLKKDSRRTSLQDLSKLSQKEAEMSDPGRNVAKKENISSDNQLKATSGLYKRESIIKSQASEEDPEYLLPERPKLVQQEREHPFKKAWQMQKSRSEEDGSPYAIKEPKDQSKTESKADLMTDSKTESKLKDDEVPTIKRERSGEQSSECEDIGAFTDEESESIMLSRSRSTDTEDTRASSKSEESMEGRDSKSYSKSDVEEDSLKINWPAEEEEQNVVPRSITRSKSEEEDWTWEEKET